MKILAHVIIVSILTIITQIGGIVWIMNFAFFRWVKKGNSKWTKLSSFLVIYLLLTFLIIPIFAKISGRVPLPITKSDNLIPHNYITPLLNRHYVKPRLKTQLLELADKTNSENKLLKVSYLDANFPFIDGFPLLPHLSHNDGRKVDLSFYYTKNEKEGNLKPSNTGYGAFVEPSDTEYNQTKECKSAGYWHYDYTKFLTLGSRNDLVFDLENTRNLVIKLVQSPLTQKILIEPHINKRMNLTNNKIRFQGCRAVRHDDHIHHQINN
ncbi:MAG: hypothetical protein IPJ51_07395 [Saprospiraceae bacterium]|nr:hypothetical protein [Saprospiraceae bacterium]